MWREMAGWARFDKCCAVLRGDTREEGERGGDNGAILIEKIRNLIQNSRFAIANYSPCIKSIALLARDEPVT